MYKICHRECGISREHRTNRMRKSDFTIPFLRGRVVTLCAVVPIEMAFKWFKCVLGFGRVCSHPVVCCNIFASLPNKCVQIDRILLALRSTVRIASNTKFIIHNIYALEPQLPRQIHWSRVRTVICTTKSPIVSVCCLFLYRVVSPGVAQASEIVLPQVHVSLNRPKRWRWQQMNTKLFAKQASANKIHGEKLKK